MKYLKLFELYGEYIESSSLGGIDDILNIAVDAGVTTKKVVNYAGKVNGDIDSIYFEMMRNPGIDEEELLQVANDVIDRLESNDFRTILVIAFDDPNYIPPDTHIGMGSGLTGLMYDIGDGLKLYITDNVRSISDFRKKHKEEIIGIKVWIR